MRSSQGRDTLAAPIDGKTRQIQARPRHPPEDLSLKEITKPKLSDDP